MESGILKGKMEPKKKKSERGKNNQKILRGAVNFVLQEDLKEVEF